MSELHLLSPKGFKANGVYAEIKTKPTPDVGLLVCDRSAAAAAVFTTNKVFAAPIKIGREHLRTGKLRAIVVNSGNANACTGVQGETDARAMCALAGERIGCPPAEVLPSSTGIIGHLLPMEKVTDGIARAAKDLGNSVDHALNFAGAILTTDTRRKAAAARFEVNGQSVTIAGVCKGAGMIGPRMGPPHATMLAYLTTDANIASSKLQQALNVCADASFNAVTIDDHTSTNDTACILASGLGAAVDDDASLKTFTAQLLEVCQSLAYQIAADGEGATKVVKIVIRQAFSEDDARLIARAIANSPLVKCAMHGNDPNWGRIVSAAGLCGAAFDPDRSELQLQGASVFRHGTPLPFDADRVSESLKAPEVLIDLACGLGDAQATLWTCDLSKEYVTINADYHT